MRKAKLGMAYCFDWGYLRALKIHSYSNSLQFWCFPFSLTLFLRAWGKGLGIQNGHNSYAFQAWFLTTA